MIKDTKKKIAIGTVVLLLVGGLAAVNIMRGQGYGFLNTGPVIEIEAQAIEKTDINSVVVASGVAELAVQREVYVDSGIKVNEVFVEAYDQVSEGQQILDLDLDDLYMQLEKERISMQIQQLTYEQSAGPGDARSLGDLESNRLLAENAVKSSRIALDEAEAGLVRLELLYEAGAASKVELEEAQKKVDDAQITYDNAAIRLANAVNSEYTGSNIQSANVAASQLRVEELEMKIRKAAEAQYAGVGGVVTAVNIKDGAVANSVEPSIVISDFGSLQIRANVNEADKNSIQIGQEVAISSDAIDESIVISGTVNKVSLLARTLETTTGKEKVFDTIVSIKDAIRFLHVLSPGQNVDCTIMTVSSHDAIVCSYDMIVEGKDQQNYVFVVDEKQQSVRKQDVKLGIIADLNAEVLEGLAEGDLVVVNPPLNLKDGSRIKITQPGVTTE